MFDAIDTCFERIKDDKNFKKYQEAILYHQVVLLYMVIIFILRKKRLSRILLQSLFIWSFTSVHHFFLLLLLAFLIF